MSKIFRVVDRAVERWVGSYPATARGLSVFRIAFAGAFLILGSPRTLWMTGYPDFFWDPTYPLAYFSCESTWTLICGFPAPAVLIFLEAAGAFAALCLLWGYKTRWASVAFTVIFVLLNQVRFSFGKIDHNLIYYALPLAMAFSGWGRFYSLDRARHAGASMQRHAAQLRGPRRTTAASYTVAVFALIIAIGFLSAGLPKAYYWLDFDLGDSGVRRWVTRGYFLIGRDEWLLPTLAFWENRYFWEAMDYAGALFEIALACSVIRGRWFKTMLFVAIGFHITNYFILNIPFWVLFPVYAAFLPWDRVAAWIEETSLRTWAAGKFTLGGLLASAVVCLPLYLVQPIDGLADRVGFPLSTFRALTIYSVAIVICIRVLIASAARRDGKEQAV